MPFRGSRGGNFGVHNRGVLYSIGTAILLFLGLQFGQKSFIIFNEFIFYKLI